MAILYLDEAGNTGLADPKQPYLLYGGVMVDPSNWHDVENSFIQVQTTYMGLLFGRINQVHNPAEIGKLISELRFFEQFHFHAAKIVNRTGMWSKLVKDDNEHFKLLDDLVEVICQNKVKFFVGAIKKSNVNPTGPKVEYATLLPSFFQYVDAAISDNHFMVIWDDGSSDEKALILKALKSPHLNNCVPELVTEKNLPMLQLADIALWITQYYLKLEPTRQDDFAENVRTLYNKLQPNLNLHKIGF